MSFVCGCGSSDVASSGAIAQPVPSQLTVEAGANQEAELKNARLPHQLPRETVPRPAKPDDWFEDLTDRSGVHFAYRDGNEAAFYELLEQVGGGVAMFDYDRDGDVDLFFTGGGRLTGPPIQVHGLPSALFRNDGDWKFTDVTQQAGLGDAGPYTHGVTAGDFDRDGWPDLFVAGYRACRLYRNGQDGTFADVTQAAGLDVCQGWNITAAWTDIDRDGWLDLYVLTYAKCEPDHTRKGPNDQGLRDVLPPWLFPGDSDRLLRNRGDGTFEDITRAAGLVAGNRGLGVVTADVDEDGWQDIYVVNDIEENQLYMGGPELPFTNEAVLAGVAFSASGEREGSMGVDVGDFNGDGLADLWYTNYTNQDNSLLRNMDRTGFLNVNDVTGVLGQSRLWVGFGTGFADFDHDGWLDLFVLNGHVAYDRLDSPYFQPAQLFRNDAGRRYVEITDQGGPYFSVPHAGRGAAVGDLDNDGAPDLVVVHQNDPVQLLRNRNAAKHWLSMELRGTKSNLDAIGAKVAARCGDRTLTRWVRGGGGYLSAFDPRVLLSLPDDSPVDVTITWPTGTTEVFSQLTPGQTHVVTEGQGQQP